MSTLNLPDEASIYGYRPTQSVCYTFVVLFGLSALIHAGLSIRYKMWWAMATFVCCSLAETIGWGGRLWASYDLFEFTTFQIQICCTIIGPTFTLAGLFIVLGQIMRRLGTGYCRLSSRWYTGVFLFCDCVALVVQAVGGGVASGSKPVLGGNIMLGGISFQLAVLTIAAVVALEYFVRYSFDAPIKSVLGANEKAPPTARGQLSKKMKIMIACMGFVTLFLFIRAVYRTIELADGWLGTIITTQVYFNLFDGAMILLAQYVLLLFHPGFLLDQGKDATQDTVHGPGHDSSATVV